ncbi:MAG: F0F1 ATP synthase subunit epsilon [Marinilabiliaceae bacterium]|nr:F0F1 ATP synthase subunit epsilon [Marinilabiliaceae bacterium]
MTTKPDDLYLELVTPEVILYSGAVGLIDVPGVSGRFQILREHGAIISILKKGIIRIIGKDSVERKYNCTGGTVECFENRVTILMDHPE